MSKSSTGKSKVLDEVIKRQGWARESIGINLKGLEQATTEIHKNLAKGPKARWSINHDILRWAQNIHKLSYELAILTNLRELATLEPDAPKTTKKKRKKKEE